MIPSKLKWIKYSNCLFGAILLWMCKGGKIIMSRRPGTRVPHWMVVKEDGLYHFRLRKDILPFPLCYLLFKGEFVKEGSSNEYA